MDDSSGVPAAEISRDQVIKKAGFLSVASILGAALAEVPREADAGVPFNLSMIRGAHVTDKGKALKFFSATDGAISVSEVLILSSDGDHDFLKDGYGKRNGKTLVYYAVLQPQDNNTPILLNGNDEGHFPHKKVELKDDTGQYFDNNQAMWVHILIYI